MANHYKFYGFPRLYHIAFSFRDVVGECGFFQAIYQHHRKRPLQSFLELAAGPADHAIQMASLGHGASALDLSAEMVDYGQQLAQSRGLSLNYTRANMVDFSLDGKFDMAVLLMDSASYLRI